MFRDHCDFMTFFFKTHKFIIIKLYFKASAFAVLPASPVYVNMDLTEFQFLLCQAPIKWLRIWHIIR